MRGDVLYFDFILICFLMDNRLEAGRQPCREHAAGGWRVGKSDAFVLYANSLLKGIKGERRKVERERVQNR